MLTLEFLTPQKKKKCNIVSFLNFFRFVKLSFSHKGPSSLLAHPAGILLQCCDCQIHLGASTCWEGMEDMAHGAASLVPHSPGDRGHGCHFARLLQDKLPLRTPCTAQTSEAGQLIILKSSGILHRTQFIMSQPPKSLVSSGHFFQLWGLRDYCESLP